MAKYSAMTIFKQNIEAMLSDRGWTIKDLADEIGMDRSNLSKIVRGVHSPNLSLLEKIAKAVGVEVFELLKQRQLVS